MLRLDGGSVFVYPWLQLVPEALDVAGSATIDELKVWPALYCSSCRRGPDMVELLRRSQLSPSFLERHCSSATQMTTSGINLRLL